MSALNLAITALKGTAAVTAKTTQSRICAVSAPQNQALDYVVVNVVSGDDEQMLAGAGGFLTSRIQVDCVSRTVAGAQALAAAVLSALEQRPTNPPSGLLDCYRDGVEFTDSSDDGTTFRVVLGFYLIHG
jgi:hypothetical protein